MRKENPWMIVLGGCVVLTATAVDSVQTGIAGIISSHLLNRPTTPFWIGMTICVGGAFAFYVWLSVLILDVLRSKKRLFKKERLVKKH